MCGCILAIPLASYGILRMAARGAKSLNPTALITTRSMGLLLAAVAIQFMLNAIQSLKGDPLRTSAQPPEIIGRQSEDVFERARKMKGIPKASFLGNLFDQRAGVLQPLSREIHLEAH